MRKLICMLLALTLTCTVFWVSAEENPVETILSTVEEMCRVFQVSRSGYYAWRARQNEAPKDQWLIDLVIECQQKCNQTYGCRRVKRWLARFKGKKVNLSNTSCCS